MSNAINWAFEEDELSIYGEGAMPDYKEGESVPWEDVKAQIRTVCIERGVTSVGARAFAGCEALDTVFLADTVNRIGFGAFKGCAALQEIDSLRGFVHRYEKTLGGEPNRIVVGMQAFRGTPWCKENYGEFYMNRGTLVEYLGEESEVVLPNGVKEIGSMAFEGRPVEKIELPTSVKNIRAYAFMNTKLQTLVVPKTVETVESYAFGYIDTLDYVEIESMDTAVAADAFGGSAVAEELAASKKGIPSLYALTPTVEPGIVGAKRLLVAKDPKRHIGYPMPIDAEETLKKKIKAGTMVLRIRYSESEKCVNYVQAIYKVKKESGLFQTYLMYPVDTDAGISAWRDSFTYWDADDILGLNTDGIDGKSMHEGEGCDWYQAVVGKSCVENIALALVGQWLKKHPGYRVLSEDENREQDPLRMFVPN